MINPSDLLNLFKKKGINFFCGVPDSVLKNFLNVLNKDKSIKNLTAVNEGSAVAVAIGKFLATRKPSVVYMQNSGLSNAINPLISIADKTVYSIPTILLIGWRGAPGLKDEPQHKAKGKITLSLLKKLNIKNVVIQSNKDFNKISRLIDYAKKNNISVAILIKNNSIYFEKKFNSLKYPNSLQRYDFIKKLLLNVTKKDKIISTTGFTSRELNEIRKDKKYKNGDDFYMVGGMGHTSSVALGFSLSNNSRVLCLDGDGAMLMHMGSLMSVANFASKKLKYILLNNNTHESVGGQLTNLNKMDIKKISLGLGFKNYFQIENNKNVDKVLKKFLTLSGPNFLNVKIKSKSIQNLKRPSNLIGIKKLFMM